MKETRHYSGLLYALADTLTDAAQAEEVREAASRLDLQTVGLNEYRRQKDQAEKARDRWIDSYARLHRKSSDRIAELERELETCRSNLMAATEACEEPNGDLLAAMQDAARYRFLRNQDIENRFPRSGVFIGRIPENQALSGNEADDAIDAAQKQEGGDK